MLRGLAIPFSVVPTQPCTLSSQAHHLVLPRQGPPTGLLPKDDPRRHQISHRSLQWLRMHANKPAMLTSTSILSRLLHSTESAQPHPSLLLSTPPRQRRRFPKLRPKLTVHLRHHHLVYSTLQEEQSGRRAVFILWRQRQRRARRSQRRRERAHTKSRSHRAVVGLPATLRPAQQADRPRSVILHSYKYTHIPSSSDLSINRHHSILALIAYGLLSTPMPVSIGLGLSWLCRR